MSKVNHAVGGSGFRIEVDDHVRRMNQLEMAENIPKLNRHYISAKTLSVTLIGIAREQILHRSDRWQSTLEYRSSTAIKLASEEGRSMSFFAYAKGSEPIESL
jgi:hypothetical protein